jgi:hypothetical protein
MANLADWKPNERLFWHWDIKFQIRTLCLVIKRIIGSFHLQIFEKEKNGNKICEVWALFIKDN